MFVVDDGDCLWRSLCGLWIADDDDDGWVMGDSVVRIRPLLLATVAGG